MAVDPMDARAHYKQLYRLARFAVGNVVFYNGRMCEVVKRYFRISEQRVLYDVRNVRTSDVLRGIPQDELLTPVQHHAQE